MTAAVMMGSMLKGDKELLTVKIQGDGPIGSLTVTADSHGHVKGYAQNPVVLIQANSIGKLDVAGAIGKGVLSVIKDIGLKDPYVGQTDLVSGEIAEDIAGYFVESEQIPTACGLGVLIDRDQSVRAAGGYLIQLMPGYTEDTVVMVEGGIMAAGNVSAILDKDPDPEHMLRQVMSDFDLKILESSEVEYRCYCSRERVERALLSLGADELASIVREQGGCQMSCQFCDTVYDFSAEELNAMIDGLRAG